MGELTVEKHLINTFCETSLVGRACSSHAEAIVPEPRSGIDDAEARAPAPHCLEQRVLGQALGRADPDQHLRSTVASFSTDAETREQREVRWGGGGSISHPDWANES